MILMKKYFHPYIITAVVFLLATKSGWGQEFIDEDYLDNIGNNVKTMLGEKLPAFSLNSVPEKWKNESAVVIGYKRSILFDKKSGGFFSGRSNNVLFFEKIRFKIKLLDRNAVKSFTEVYFRYGDKEDGFAASIVKPDGQVEPVDLKDAVDVESKQDVPEFFKSFFDRSYSLERRYYKVGIPNLEPGDILEYVANTKSKLDVTGSGGLVEFPAQYEVCAKAYPILYNEIAIETDDKSFFKSLSGNGAPAFKKEASDEKGFYRYVFIDKDRGTEKDISFINQLLVYPFVKFQVVYANNEKIKGALIGAEGELKKGFSKEELAKKAWEDYENTGKSYYRGGTVDGLVEGIWSQLKKFNANEGAGSAYADKAYYYIRGIVAKSDGYLSDKTFAYLLRGLLEKRNISSELVISINNDVGKLEDILFDDEVRYMVKAKNQIYFNCTDHSSPDDQAELLLGSRAYIIGKPIKKGSEQEVKPFEIPGTAPDQNTVTYNIDVSLDPTLSNLLVSRKSSYTGLSKTNQINQAMRYTSFVLDDYKNYDGEDPTATMTSRQLEEYEKSVTAFKESLKESKPEYVKAQLQNEYNQKIKMGDFKIVSDGRSAKKRVLSYVENFELTGKVRRVGKKYLINLPGLTAGQLQIKKEERNTRKHDITISFPRTLVWNIVFKIPDGYTVAGLEELKISINNEAGSFAAIATQESNMVKLSLTKIYKQRVIPKEKWNEMLAYLDEAYNTMYKFILLTPKINE
jgi:hypothetical protein